MGQRSNLLVRHAGRPLQAVVLNPFPAKGGVPCPRGVVLVTPQSRCAALRCRGGAHRSGNGGGVGGGGGGDVPFPPPPPRRRRAGSGLAAPGARGARGRGRGLSPHEAVVGVGGDDRSRCRLGGVRLVRSAYQVLSAMVRHPPC